MASYETSRFRITAWPSVPLDVRPAFAVRRLRLEGDRMVPLDTMPTMEWIDLPDEWYLREVHEVDLEDPESMLEFARRYGWMAGPDAVARPATLHRKGVPGSHQMYESLDEFRWYMTSLRSLAGDWETLLAGEGDSTAEALFLERVNVGLAPFAPGLSAGPERYRWWAQAYNIGVLQFFNHVVERAPFSTCQLDTCQTRFVRQRGRAKHGQNRLEGVLYCSARCARAVAARKHRRRKKEAG